MQEFNYEHNFVPNIFHFDDEVIVNKLFFLKKLKFKQPVKSYLKILRYFYMKRYCEKSEITKKTQNNMILAV